MPEPNDPDPSGRLRADTFIYDADGNVLAEIDSAGVDDTDPVGNLYCGAVAKAIIDPADTSCFPFGQPGYPMFFPSNTETCSAGTCVITP